MKRSAVALVLAPSILSGCAVLTPITLAPLSRRPAPAATTAAAPAPSAPAPTPTDTPRTTTSSPAPAYTPPPMPTPAPTPKTGPVKLTEDTGSRVKDGITFLPYLTFRAGKGWKHDVKDKNGEDHWTNSGARCVVSTNNLKGGLGLTDAEATRQRVAEAVRMIKKEEKSQARPMRPVIVSRPGSRPVEFAALTGPLPVEGRAVTYIFLTRSMIRDDLTLEAAVMCTGRGASSQGRIMQVARSLQIVDSSTR